MSGSSPGRNVWAPDIAVLASASAKPVIDAILTNGRDIDQLNKALFSAQKSLAESLNRELSEPIIWVNTYLKTKFDKHTSTQPNDRARRSFKEDYVYLPSAITLYDQQIVTDIHEAIDNAHRAGAASLTQEIKNTGNPATISFHQNAGALACDFSDLNCGPLQHYVEILRLNATQRYIHLGLPTRGDELPIEAAGVFMMLDCQESWDRCGALLSTAFRYFLLEIVFFRIWEITKILLNEKKRIDYVFSQIHEPAVTLVKQLHAVEATASRIRSVLSPPDAIILQDLRRADEFFINPPERPIAVGGVEVVTIHDFGNKWPEKWDNRRHIFVCAVLARILALEGVLDEHILKYLIDKRLDDDSANASALAITLRHVLCVGEWPASCEDKAIADTRAQILKGICHTPFKIAENSFDANLCYGIFRCREPIAANDFKPFLLQVAGPPQQFVQGCLSLLAPHGLNELEEKSTVELVNDGTRKKLRIKREGRFEPIVDPARVANLVLAASGGQLEQPKDAQSALWEWATAKLLPDSHQSRTGNTVGALLMLFGSVAKELAPPSPSDGNHGGTVAFIASGTSGLSASKSLKLEISFRADTNFREVTVGESLV